jgi:hypothetical protein
VVNKGRSHGSGIFDSAVFESCQDKLKLFIVFSGRKSVSKKMLTNERQQLGMVVPVGHAASMTSEEIQK